MKFLSDILAKAGLTVDGVVTLNNTATGQTPDANDNSTKLATTAWVRTFVQPYSLPIATASILGGIKVGEGLSINATTGVLSTVGGASITSFRSEYIITATAGQTTFTVPNGYTPGKIDLFLNGVYLNDTIYTATNSSTIVLDDAAALDDILTVFVYSTYYVGDSPSARTTTYFTATSNQTVFTVDYVIGQVDIFYNGSKLEPSEYTANNGTSITLLTPATTGDKIEVVNWAVGGGIAATRTITIDGVAQDLTANRTWNILPTGGAAGDILAKTSATNYAVAWIPNYTSTVQHTVKAAVSLTAGQAVYVSSADGTNMIVSKASNASEQTSSKTLGLVAQNLAINGQGFVVTEGLLAGLDTTGANAAGDPVWLGTDGNLIYGLVNKPVAPAHLVFIGVVTRRNANNGEIFVKVQNGFELDELHDLSVASPSDGDMIKYVASTGLWTKIAATTTNIAEGTNLYYTNTRSRTAISLTTSGTSGAATYDNATGVINIPQYQGGVTSFNTRTGAITLSSSDVTTALTYTPVTNARTLTINGTTYDLSADRSWSIASGVTSFNTRTGAISLTSLDVTDALTYTPVTNARTLTINGTSYDLSANRSWTIAPDTSVRNIYGFTATANQTTFTVSGGYTVGLVDVFINGVKLAAADFTATNGTTVVLGTGTGVGNIVEIIKYVSAFTTAVETTRTLTINGTTYDLSANRTWSIDNASLGAQPQLNGTGLVRMSGTTVSYDNATYATQSYVTTAVANLVNSAPTTLDTLNELATALGNDANFATTITTSIGTKQAQLNGTGFVKISGTTISYDNSTYLTTASASSTYLPLAGGTLTGPLSLRDTTNGFVGLRLEGTGTYSGSDWIIYASSTNPSTADDFLGFYNSSTTDGGVSEYKFRLFKTGAAVFSGNITLTNGYIDMPWASDTRTIWERYYSASYFQRISSNGTLRQLRLESNGAYGNASIVLDGQSNTTVTATITSDKFVATGVSMLQGELSVGTGTLSADRMMQVSGTSFTSGSSQFASVFNPTFGNNISNLYGIYISLASGTSVTNRYQLYVDGAGGGTATNDYSIYVANTAKSYFAGSVVIGTNSSTEKFEVNAGTGSRTGMALTGEYPYFKFNTISSNANARNWIITPTWAEFGDLVLAKSTTKDGNPLTTGANEVLYFARGGDARFYYNLSINGNTTINGGESLKNGNSTWFRQTFERNVTSWDSVVGFTPQNSPQYTYGYINITASAYNNGTSAGGVVTSRWYYSITNNSISVSVVGSDITTGSQAPMVRLLVTSGVIYVQVQSTNGSTAAYTTVFVDAMLASGYVNGTSWAIS